MVCGWDQMSLVCQCVVVWVGVYGMNAGCVAGMCECGGGVLCWRSQDGVVWCWVCVEYEWYS